MTQERKRGGYSGTKDGRTMRPPAAIPSGAAAAPCRRYVTLITGPPCAGKTTYAQTHAAGGDTIVDYDVIAAELGSSKTWIHSPEIRQRTSAIARQRMDHVRAMTDGAAWVIRGAPNPYERAQLAQWLRADRVIVLLPSADILRARMRQRPQPGHTLRGLNKWMHRYAPAHGDELITDPGE